MAVVVAVEQGTGSTSFCGSAFVLLGFVSASPACLSPLLASSRSSLRASLPAPAPAVPCPSPTLHSSSLGHRVLDPAALQRMCGRGLGRRAPSALVPGTARRQRVPRALRRSTESVPPPPALEFKASLTFFHPRPLQARVVNSAPGALRGDVEGPKSAGGNVRCPHRLEAGPGGLRLGTPALPSGGMACRAWPGRLRGLPPGQLEWARPWAEPLARAPQALCFAVTRSLLLTCLLPAALLGLRYYYSRKVILAYLECALHTDMADIEQYYMKPPGSCFWVAVLDGNVVGIVAARAHEEDNTVELLRMSVDSRFRGKGIAKALGRKVLEFALVHNYSAVVLGTTAVKVAAHKLYESLGFRHMGASDHYVLPGMTLSLAERLFFQVRYHRYRLQLREE
ncbi:PREDICTED: N-acetylaspartate synthetase [Galeopterus variegatus]|uniref:N-acetylaspartate synthetase n=1 Tax=Galeopterus variegatus TaxID=482537 RepID=A0ABM0QH59_GALVR|nr:PREDICTED: N-acetylaspartate synthetase [Galeopterus variegatus]